MVERRTSIVFFNRLSAASRLRSVSWKSRSPSLNTLSTPFLTFRSILACCEIPFRRKAVRESKMMLSSTADRADVTISLALKTLLIEDKDLFDARR